MGLLMSTCNQKILIMAEFKIPTISRYHLLPIVFVVGVVFSILEPACGDLSFLSRYALKLRFLLPSQVAGVVNNV